MHPIERLAASPSRRTAFARHLEKIRVLAEAEFKVKYAGSVLSYAWALVKPLALFTILYLVFGRALRFGGGLRHYPLYLLFGIVVFSFFSEATSATMTSLVARAHLLRRVAFPHLVVPIAVTLTAGFTFLINLLAMGVFVLASGLALGPRWLLVAPLAFELYVYTVAVGILLSTLYVLFRDIRQIWDLLLQVLFYATPIIYPLQFLPLAAQRLAFLNPLTQIVQDMRASVLGESDAPTVANVFGSSLYRVLPLLIVAVTLSVALWFFRRQEDSFAERV